jgi:hypothetical protein
MRMTEFFNFARIYKMFSNPFSTTVATTVGESLAKIVIESVPLETEKKDLKLGRKVELSMRKISQQIEWLKLEHQFNFFQKAKLGTALKWKLKDAGYKDTFTSELTEWVLMKFK